jgi:hypothetical protein
MARRVPSPRASQGLISLAITNGKLILTQMKSQARADWGDASGMHLVAWFPRLATPQIGGPARSEPREGHQRDSCARSPRTR